MLGRTVIAAITLAAASMATVMPVRAQSSEGDANDPVKKVADGITDAATSGVQLLEGLVGAIFNPTESEFRGAIKERRFDDAFKVYEKEATALQRSKDLHADIELLLAEARKRHAPIVEGAIVDVSAARAGQLYRKDVVGYFGKLKLLNEARDAYRGKSRILRDFDPTDPVLERARSEEAAAKEALRADLAVVYREFPHESMAFSAAVPEPANERDLFAGNWEALSQKVGTLDEGGAKALLRNTSAAWAGDPQLRAKVGSVVWKKLLPQDGNPVATLKAVKAVDQFGLSRADVKERPRLVVVNSVPAGSELGVRFTTNHDGALMQASELVGAISSAPVDKSVMIEIQETHTKRNILEKKEVNSEYKAGTRAVPNPNYAIAQANCQRAQAEAAAQQARNTIAPAQHWAGALLQGLAGGIASARADNVCNEFRSISPTTEEDVFSPYAYTVSDIEVTRVARGRVVAVDASGGVLETYPIAIEEKTRHQVAFGRKDADRAPATAISDGELERLATKAFELDPEKLVDSLGSATRLAYSQDSLSTLLAERPQASATASKVVAVAEAPASGSFTHTAAVTNSAPLVDTANSDPRMQSVVVVLNPKGSLGAGFYVDTNDILTNFHVVEGASTIEVRGIDGKLFTGRVVKKDIGTDLALIRVERAGTPAPLSQAILKPGDAVEAIGHPKGFYYSVSRGVVSALRQMKGMLAQGGDRALVIQTDTAINPGNSGGPLFFRDRVVGVNTVKFKGADGIGFAVHYSEIIKFLSQ